MPKRKWRIPVVLDTNVFVAALLSQRRDSPNVEVVRLWRTERKLQLIVSSDILAEYLETFERIGLASRTVEVFQDRLRRRDIVTHVSPGPRFHSSRDPDDDLLLAAARAGRAKYLITHDFDLLEINSSERRRFTFEIVTPAQFLVAFAADGE